MKPVGPLCIAVMMLACAAASCLADETIVERGRQFTQMFYDGDLEVLWQRLSGPLQAEFGDRQKLVAFREQVRSQLGAERELVDESTATIQGMDVYLRTVRFEKLEQLILVQWAFDDKGVVTGFHVQPAPQEAPTDYLDYETQTKLRLPFEGEWYVFWGGRALRQNYHAKAEDQRFAYDILIMKDGVSHAGDGAKNEDYYCFGKPVLAPGGGVVFAMANDVEDNPPGKMNPDQALGNHVIIDHGNGEFSFLAHMKKGSVTVAKGRRVKAGDRLGLCGNSGNTTEPHIHYHLQTTGEFQRGKGLPAQFENYVADGKHVARGEPVKGQAVAPAH